MNRRQKPAPVRLGLAFRVLALCLILAAPPLGYIEQKNQLARLGSQYREVETKLENVRRDNATRSRSLDYFKTPLRLEAAVRELNLGLGPPAPNQIVRLGGRAPASEPGRFVSDESRQVAVNR